LRSSRNSAIQKNRASLEATYGVVVQTRAIALPKVNVSSSYTANEDSSTDRFMPKSGSATNNFIANAFEFADQRWSADVRVHAIHLRRWAD